jgi:hypothetical protein
MIMVSVVRQRMVIFAVRQRMVIFAIRQERIGMEGVYEENSIG